MIITRTSGSALADLIDSKRLLYLLLKPLLYLYFRDIGSSGAVANMRTYDRQTRAEYFRAGS